VLPFALLAVPFAPLATAPPRSDPAGVYARIDKVVLLPDAQKPQRAEIHGAFAVATGRFGDHYCTPQWGRLLLALPAQKPEEVLAQWRELQELAGANQLVSFSSRREQQNVRVWRDGEPQPEAGTMAAGFGMQKLEGLDYGPVQQLRLLPRPLPLSLSAPPPNEDRTPTVEVEFAAQNCPHAQDGLVYVFEVEKRDGQCLASGPVAPGKDTTAWKTELALRSGEVLQWRVHVLHPRFAATPVATSRIVVAAAKAATRER
jgi:hypothetical protein